MKPVRIPLRPVRGLHRPSRIQYLGYTFIPRTFNSTRNTVCPSGETLDSHFFLGLSAIVSIISFAMFSVYTLGSIFGVKTHSTSLASIPVRPKTERNWHTLIMMGEYRCLDIKVGLQISHFPSRFYISFLAQKRAPSDQNLLASKGMQAPRSCTILAVWRLWGCRVSLF